MRVPGGVSCVPALGKIVYRDSRKTETDSHGEVCELHRRYAGLHHRQWRKADIGEAGVECPLLAQSGHSGLRFKLRCGYSHGPLYRPGGPRRLNRLAKNCPEERRVRVLARNAELLSS